MSKMIVVLFAAAVLVSSFVPAAIAQGPDSPNGNAIISGYGKITLVVGTPTIEAQIGVFATIHVGTNHTLFVAFKNKQYAVTPQHDLVVFMAIGDTLSITTQNGPAIVDIVTSKTGDAVNLNHHLMLPVVRR